MPKYESERTLYPHPFSGAYWRSAARELKDLRKLTFAALMIALCVVLSHIPAIHLPGDTQIQWTFMAKATAGWVCGPVLGMLFAVAEDTLSFFLTGGAGTPYFPGYTLTTVLGLLTYAAFFYRARPTVGRIIGAKFCINVQNVVLGSLWSAILTGKGWLVIAPIRAAKNAILLPAEILVLILLFHALAPVLYHMHLIPWKPAPCPGKAK